MKKFYKILGGNSAYSNKDMFSYNNEQRKYCHNHEYFEIVKKKQLWNYKNLYCEHKSFYLFFKLMD